MERCPLRRLRGLMRLVLSVCLCLSLASLASAQFNFPAFAPSDIGSGAGQITINGDTVLANSSLQLTTAGDGYTSGSAFYNTKQSLQGDFYTDFRYNIPGGDGIAFLLNDNPAGPNMLGPYGGYLGYMGEARTLAVEFDNFNNSDGDVIGISVRAGTTSGFGGGFGSVSNGVEGVHDVRIAYHGSTLAIYLDEFSAPVLSVDNLSLADYVDGNNSTYLGFSAGEALVYGDQAIQQWSFNHGDPVPEPATVVTLGGALLACCLRLRGKQIA